MTHILPQMAGSAACCIGAICGFIIAGNKDSSSEDTVSVSKGMMIRACCCLGINLHLARSPASCGQSPRLASHAD